MSETAKNKWLRIASNLHIWRRGGERAVHKPLLTLLIIARAAREQNARIAYEEIEIPLTRLLREFGPRRKTDHPEMPFWHLQHEGFWIVENAESFSPNKKGNTPTKNTLRMNQAAGYVPPDMWAALVQDEKLRWDLSQQILYDFWASSIHGSICQAIGLPDEAPDNRTIKRPTRDPNFRIEVIRAYERSCAVCGYDGRIADLPLALEAAHIRWHSYGGPDRVENGLALCSFHHVALDSGAIGISQDNTLMISCDITGSSMVAELLLRFAGLPLRKPQLSYPPPDKDYIHWHAREVFKAPARRPYQEKLAVPPRAAEDRDEYQTE